MRNRNCQGLCIMVMYLSLASVRHEVQGIKSLYPLQAFSTELFQSYIRTTEAIGELREWSQQYTSAAAVVPRLSHVMSELLRGFCVHKRGLAGFEALLA